MDDYNMHNWEYESDSSGLSDNITKISKLDVSHPLHLHPNDSATLTVVSIKLKGTENYNVWSCAMLLALEGKNKTGFIDGTCKRSNTNEVLGRQWDRVNAVVLGWILNSISEELFLGQIFSKRASHVWEELKETYDKVDGSVTFNLHHKINSMSQNGSSLAEYYHKLNSLWKQFDALVKLPRCTCHAADDFKKHNQLIKLMQFLMGLDDSYMQIRSNILTKEPLPDVRSAYAIISSEESHRVLASGSSVNGSHKAQNSVFTSNVAPKSNFQKFQSQNSKSASNFRQNEKRTYNSGASLVCENCGFNGHTIDRCFKIIGYPADFGKKKSFQNFKNKGIASNNSLGKDTCVPSSSSTGFSDEQMATLISLIKCNSEKGSGVNANMAGFRSYSDSIVQSLALMYPNGVLFSNTKKKGARVMQFIRNASASVQPLTEDPVEETSQDLPTSGNSIRRRFLEFYAARGHKILPSSSLVPDDPTVLLTIAGMLQFKPIFLGKVPRQVASATTSQRCIRTNDIENVGHTSRHHTFFEMLGNFSFGDYFKKEAIKWAWELSTLEYGLSTENLWISVYENDEETYTIWHDEIGVPADRIKKMGEEDNFWTSGVTGPCGPCSEIYYDFHPDRGNSNVDLNDDTRFIEFYNLVFMQFNKKDDGSLEPLKQKNIDTGMGLERLARILQKVPNNYETDLIFPIIEKVSELANVSYARADDSTKTKLKVIGDHMRAIVYLISDGVFPSNIGRGYVVRRLIRRAVRMGRLLDIRGDENGNLEGAFLPIVAEKVIALSSQIDPELKTRKSRILEELKREELRFVMTLERGEKLLDEKLDEALANAKVNKTAPCLSGKDAFLLYDTYGFPVEITMEVADERGVSVDMTDFDIEMENQRRQSQAAHNTIKLTIEDGSELTENIPDTEFVGYDTLYSNAIIKGLLLSGKPVFQVSQGSEVEVLLDRTPFYAESGGQIGDRGLLKVTETESQKTAVIEIADVQKSLGNIFVHKGTIKEGSIEVGREVEAAVDAKLRQRAKVHHTATHLLQAALKKVIGQETSQAGSLVAFERLRFDFNFHQQLLDHELTKVEDLINEWIGDATPLQTKVMAIADAKSAGAIAMFGEKYGEEVRVVDVPGVSMELCGGTHVSNTSEIRGFKIISEQGISSGVRRIEAVAGDAFIEYVSERDNYMKQLCSTLKVKAEEVPTRVAGIMEELRIAKGEVSAARAKTAVYKASIIANNAFHVGTSTQIRVLVEFMDDTDADSLKSAAEYLIDVLEDPAAIILGSSPSADKVSLIAAFSPSVVSMGVQAGKFIGPIAKICGGGGGGRPNFAQAGGRKPENLSSALEKAKSDLVSVLSEKAS